MPTSPYPIEGIITGIDGNPAQGVRVNIYNLETGESHGTNTNSTGRYVIDLANFSRSYEDQQQILIRAEIIGKYPKLGQLTHRIDTSKGSATINIQMEPGLPTQPVAYSDEETKIREHDPIMGAKRVMTENILNKYFPADGEMNYGATSYYGFIDRNGNWYIRQDAQSGAVTSYRYIKGVKDYSTNWDNRASLSYKHFHEVFG